MLRQLGETAWKVICKRDPREASNKEKLAARNALVLLLKLFSPGLDGIGFSDEINPSKSAYILPILISQSFISHSDQILRFLSTKGYDFKTRSSSLIALTYWQRDTNYLTTEQSSLLAEQLISIVTNCSVASKDSVREIDGEVSREEFTPLCNGL